MPMLATAFRRLELYESTYGFTGERVWAQACSLFVGLMLVWRGVTLWTWPWRFGVGAVASAVLVLLGMNVLDPDDFVARRNLQRPADAVALDRGYLRSLSADAAPALLEAGIDPAQPADEGLASFNLARPAGAEVVARVVSRFNLRRAARRAACGDFSSTCLQVLAGVAAPSPRPPPRACRRRAPARRRRRPRGRGRSPSRRS